MLNRNTDGAQRTKYSGSSSTKIPMLSPRRFPAFLFALSRRVFVNGSTHPTCTGSRRVSSRFVAKGLRQQDYRLILRFRELFLFALSRRVFVNAGAATIWLDLVSIRFVAKGLRQHSEWRCLRRSAESFYSLCREGSSSTLFYLYKYSSTH